MRHFFLSKRLPIHRLAHSFQRFSTGAQQKQSFLEHMNTNGYSYVFIVCLIASWVGGIDYVMTRQLKPLHEAIDSLDKTINDRSRSLEKSKTDLFQSLEESMNELKAQRKENMDELRRLLIPLVIQVQVNKERLKDLEKEFDQYQKERADDSCNAE